MSAYQVIWYLLIGVLLAVYAILDGFDLGVGFWHLWTKRDEDRRTLLNSIGPVWDGNEVWLLTGGGALFAAFPPVYASVFSGFYLAMVLVLLTLITRAVALEFRSKEPSATWRRAWDVGFSLSSVLAALLFGVALGNILRGIPLTEARDYAGTFFGLLNPYALLVGVLAVAMVAFHGALYIVLKTSGELEERARGWASGAGVVYLVLFLAATAVTIATQSHLLDNARSQPVLWAVPVHAAVFIALAIASHRQARAGRAFLLSSLSIAGVMGCVGAGLFPRLVPALGTPERSLTAANASSSELTLKVMLILVVLVLPIVLAYTAWVYWAFRGKVDVGHESNHY